MMRTDDLQDKDVIITPFCADGVLLFHRFQRCGIGVSLFFDRNPLMENKEYCGVGIRRLYRRMNCEIFVCKEDYYDEILEALIGKGFPRENIHKVSDVELSVSNYDVSSEIDFETFKKMLPATMTVYTDSSDFLKLKKIKRIKELGGPYKDFTYEDFEGMWRKDNYVDLEGKTHIFIKRFELDVTSKCTLRCKNCGGMMQYVKHPRDIEAAVVISDYNRMLQLIEWTDDVLIMGGEPFACRGLAKILQGIKTSEYTETKVGMVKLVTNGTIVPEEEVLRELSGTDISVMISNYGALSKKLNELITVFREYDIKYDILDIDAWGNVQQLVEREYPMTKQELLEKRKKCWKRHHAISEGRFYLCAFSNFSQKLGAVPYSDANYVDLYDIKAAEKIYEFLRQDMPLPESCSWCNGNFPENWEGEGRLPVAEQSKEVIPYRVFEEVDYV